MAKHVYHTIPHTECQVPCRRQSDCRSHLASTVQDVCLEALADRNAGYAGQPSLNFLHTLFTEETFLQELGPFLKA